MKKIEILLIVLMIVCIVLLSGCTEQDEVSRITKDTDNDGYTDDADDFPLDNNLHEKAPFNDLDLLEYNITLAPNSGQDFYSNPNITSDWKYIICNWYVTEPLLTKEQAESVILEVKNPITGPIIRYYSNDSYSHELRFTINNDNLGVWNFGFGNFIAEDVDTSPITVNLHIELYKIR